MTNEEIAKRLKAIEEMEDLLRGGSGNATTQASTGMLRRALAWRVSQG